MTTIRVLDADDADAYRALRLEGLQDSPTSFGADFDDEARLARGEFVRRLQPSERSWVLGAHDGQNRLIGCAGWYRDQGAKVSHKSHVWGMFVTPNHRRKGIARRLMIGIMERARENAGVTQIELFVAAGNTSAASLYEHAGFKRVAVHPNSLFVGGRYIDEELFMLCIA